jgi:acetolactate synthase regulatory subunit
MASAIEERAATDEAFARQVEGAVNRVLTLKRARGLATCAP